MRKEITINALKAEEAKRSFRAFVKLFWTTTNPVDFFVDGWYIKAICDHLQAVYEGKIKRLLVCMPPRHLKTTIISIMYPAWVFLQNPGYRFLCASYSLKLSESLNNSCRDLINSRLYQAYYGYLVQLSDTQNKKEYWETSGGGHRMATSPGGSNTGFGGHAIIIDDPIKACDAHNPAERKKCIEWWKSTMGSRLNDLSTGSKIVVSQRLHEDDLPGYILKTDKSNLWCKLMLPMEYCGDNAPNALGWSDPRTKQGELLTTRFDDETILDLKHTLGSAAYFAQYQQAPSPEGVMIKEDDLRYYRIEGDDYILGERRIRRADLVGRRFACMDIAATAHEQSDYTAIGVFDYTQEGDLILVKMLRKRMNPNELIPTMRVINEIHAPRYFTLEKAAMTNIVIQSARQAGLPVRGVPYGSGKDTRAIPLCVRIESHQVWLPNSKEENDELVHELCTFPAGTYDDQVDVFSFAAGQIQNIRKANQASGIAEKPPDEADVYRRALMQGVFCMPVTR